MRIRSRFFFLWVLLLGCGGSPSSSECEGLGLEQCGTPDAGAPDAGTPPDSPIIVDTDWLQANLSDPELQLIDTRGSGYDVDRIPGAIRLRPSELAATVDGVPSQVAPPGEAEQTLRAAGLRSDAIAVVYGAPQEYDAARVVWTLRYYGHDAVHYLDGGYAAWVDAGGAVDSEPPSVEPTDYTIGAVDESLRVTGDWVLEQLGEDPYEMPAIQLVDARSGGEYGGGHIPSARSVDWTRNLDGGFLRPEAELDALYDGLVTEKSTVTYCVSGWRGSFAWLTLTALGYEDVRLYDGSWNEWGSGGFPVER